MPPPTAGRGLQRRSQRTCRVVHGMRVRPARLVLHLAFACEHYICFALLFFDGFFVFDLFVYGFCFANKIQSLR